MSLTELYIRILQSTNPVILLIVFLVIVLPVYFYVQNHIYKKSLKRIYDHPTNCISIAGIKYHNEDLIPRFTYDMKAINVSFDIINQDMLNNKNLKLIIRKNLRIGFFQHVRNRVSKESDKTSTLWSIGVKYLQCLKIVDYEEVFNLKLLSIRKIQLT